MSRHRGGADVCAPHSRWAASLSPRRSASSAPSSVASSAKAFAEGETTIVVTTTSADSVRSAALRAAGVAVRQVPAGPRGLDLPAVLPDLRRSGVQSLMVEPGAAVMTSPLAGGC
jgi:riboflavin biosynthesis pyrimidine reductase